MSWIVRESLSGSEYLFFSLTFGSDPRGELAFHHLQLQINFSQYWFCATFLYIRNRATDIGRFTKPSWEEQFKICVTIYTVLSTFSTWVLDNFLALTIVIEWVDNTEVLGTSERFVLLNVFLHWRWKSFRVWCQILFFLSSRGEGAILKTGYNNLIFEAI